MAQFRPKNNQRYWYLNGEINHPYFINVADCTWDSEYDDGNYINVFKTRVAAQKALNKILLVLR